MTGCRSANTMLLANAFVTLPCQDPDPNHPGDCEADGVRWVRLCEILRQRGLRMVGPRVRSL